MSLIQLALKNLRFHWRTNLPVALGVMAATAVLAGALVVGDCVRGSLRSLVVDRLGRVDAALVAPQFFRQDLVQEVARTPSFTAHFASAAPAIVLQATLENPSPKRQRRAGQVTLLGADNRFFDAFDQPIILPSGDGIVLNEPLADQLEVAAGDDIVVRLPQAAQVPADSPLGRKSETIRSGRFIVQAVVPAAGPGGFSLRPSQQLPLNAFVAVDRLQRMLDVSGRINAIFITGKTAAAGGTSSEAEEALKHSLQPTLADYGLSLHPTPQGYFNLTTDRMILDRAVEQAASEALGRQRVQPVYTYLANYILAGEGGGKIPYSTIAAVDFTDEPPLGPFKNRQGEIIGPLQQGEIVLNSWAADDLAAQGSPVKPGDEIELEYFQPESTHGKIVQSRAKFRLKDVVVLAGAAADPNFTPEVKGVTDEESIANWNPPFPYDPARVRSVPPNDEDDRYWQQHRATPKGFVSLAQGRQLWGSRFGRTTSIRILSEGDSAESLAGRLRAAIPPADLGFAFLPVRRLSLAAAAGTTPFAVLFLLFSMFIIAAAMMLIVLLFRLGVDYRAAETGLLMAVGMRPGAIRRLYLAEGALVASLGSLFGILGAVAYAWLMLVGLQTWWLPAISSPFLELFVKPSSLVFGFMSGLALAFGSIAFGLRQITRQSVRGLLAGRTTEAFSRRRRANWSLWGGIVLVVFGIIAAMAGVAADAQARPAAFFASGALVLCGLLLLAWHRLRGQSTGSLIGGQSALARLAIRNSTRFALRSVLSIGLMAVACFLIVSVSAFELQPPRDGPKRTSGDGGFAWIAQSDQPVYDDLNSAEARAELGFGGRSESMIANALSSGARIYSLRMQGGDDASCLNLYQARQPRILGLPQDFLQRGGFAWAAYTNNDPSRDNPWEALARSSGANQSAPIPVVLDQNTALYSLHLYGGVGEIFEIDAPRGGTLRLQVAGLLQNSIFQGDLLIGEEDFLRQFPDTSGYQVFLIENSAGNPADDKLAHALEAGLGDYGLDAQSTASRLAAFFAVQNTYLATFRSLGGLGLLLGAMGLSAAQLRSISQRRSELALLRATGFRRIRLAQLVLLENAWLLVAGLGIGCLAAMIVLGPQLLTADAAIPWWALGGLLIAVFAVGLVTTAIAAQWVLRAPLLDALRGK